MSGTRFSQNTTWHTQYGFSGTCETDVASMQCASPLLNAVDLATDHKNMKKNMNKHFISTLPASCALC